MRTLQTLFAISLIAAASAVNAQPGGQHRPPPMDGPKSGMMIIRMSTVQTELQLTDAQKQQIANLRPPQRPPQQGERGAPPADPLAKILSEPQLARLKQLVLQFDSPQSIMDRQVARQLQLSEEQRNAIHEAILANMPPPEERGSEPPVWTEMQAKKAAASAAAMQVLTESQKQTWNILIGAKFTNWVEPPRR